jgi:pre-mRNA-splicing helicase BRR2
LANARDLGEWMGVSSQAIFNFTPSARPLPLEVHIQSFTIPHFPSLMIAMAKPAFSAILQYAPTKPVIAFVPSRRQCRLTATDILTYCTADGNEDRFLNIEEATLAPFLERISDQGLVDSLKHGIGYYHEALSKQDKRVVERLFESGAIQLLIASKVYSCNASSEQVLMSNRRKLPGVFRSNHTWPSSWVFNHSMAKIIVISTTP